VFDYGHRTAADQMRTSWEKIVQYVGIYYGKDISIELGSKEPVTLEEPQHTQEVMEYHRNRERVIRNNRETMQRARERTVEILKLKIAADADDTESPIKLAAILSELAVAKLEAKLAIPVKLSKEQEAAFKGRWRTH